MSFHQMHLTGFAVGFHDLRAKVTCHALKVFGESINRIAVKYLLVLFRDKDQMHVQRKNTTPALS